MHKGFFPKEHTMKRTFIALPVFLFSFLICVPGFAQNNRRKSGKDVNHSKMQINPEAKSFKFSTTVEKERPQLDETTKKLIAECRKNPTEANKAALRKQVEINYDKVVAKKKAKLEELKRTAKDQSKIDEMQEIVDEMLRDRENRVNQSMARFLDSRMKPNARQNKDGFLPVIGAAENVSVAYAAVTNEEYSVFIKESGYPAPQSWSDGKMPKGKENYPAVNVSYKDAAEYCKWLTKKDGKAKYRLPTEQEWEIAAGHMPKDADFNSGEKKGLTPVNEYSGTLSASGAIDMWGNVWEWTSTERNGKKMAVKGGAWDSKRTECRTENRSEGRNPAKGYANVGFRIIREK